MLNKLAKEVHQNAKAHGWWEENRSFGEIIALCHSELSEALEEYRNGTDNIRKLPIYYSGEGYVANKPTECCKKPEGIATELADCIIRILDYFGHENAEFNKTPTFMIAKEINNFGEFISLLHLYLSRAYEHNSLSPLKGAVSEIYDYCTSKGINVEAAIEIKHEYNKTRPYRHGGKVI